MSTAACACAGASHLLCRAGRALPTQQIPIRPSTKAGQNYAMLEWLQKTPGGAAAPADFELSLPHVGGMEGRRLHPSALSARLGHADRPARWASPSRRSTSPTPATTFRMPSPGSSAPSSPRRNRLHAHAAAKRPSIQRQSAATPASTRQFRRPAKLGDSAFDVAGGIAHVAVAEGAKVDIGRRRAVEMPDITLARWWIVVASPDPMS